MLKKIKKEINSNNILLTRQPEGNERHDKIGNICCLVFWVSQSASLSLSLIFWGGFLLLIIARNMDVWVLILELVASETLNL